MSPLPAFRDRIIARSKATAAQQVKQQEVGRQQGVNQPPSSIQHHQQRVSASSASSPSRMQQLLDHKKSMPDTTNRAALALNRNTQSYMQQAMQNRHTSPSAEYLRVQRLQKMREKLQPQRQRTGRER